jgi:hypothetical protein
MGRGRDRENRLVGFNGIRSTLGAHWRPIWDLDFKNNVLSAGALTENAGSLTTLDGVQYHYRASSGGNEDATVTADTGIVVDFSGSGSAQSRIAFKVPTAGIQLSDMAFPRLRVSASFSSLTVSHASDYIFVGIYGMFNNAGAAFGPAVYSTYDCNATTPTFKYAGSSVQTFGTSTTSVKTLSPQIDPDGTGNTSGVLTTEDRGQGIFYVRGNDGSTAIKIGQQTQTYRGFLNAPAGAYEGSEVGRNFYSADASVSFTGPYAVLGMRKGSNGSQAVTWERMIVEAYI